MPRKERTKPTKPYDGFPLTAHPGGQWCKRIHGKLRYFGVWEDPEAALANFVRYRDGGGAVEGATLDDLCQRFLTSHEQRVEQGERTRAGYQDYLKESKRLTAHFGRTFPLSKLNAWHLEQYRATWPKAWSAKTVENVVTRTRVILRYAHEHELIEAPIRFGSSLDRPDRRKVETEKANKPARYFSRKEIHAILEHANPQLTAMIHLGLNLGFGNADVGRLEWSDLDFGLQWLCKPRGKTGEWREGWLWPETIAALEALKTPRNGLVFITKYGKPWYADGENRSPITLEFRRLTESAGCRRKGVNFYALRHTFLTHADEVNDPAAVRVIMGHRDPTVTGGYRRSMKRERIVAVCNHVRTWFLPIKK